MTIIMMVIKAFLMVTSTVRLLARLGREAGRSGGVFLSWTVSIRLYICSEMCSSILINRKKVSRTKEKNL